MGVLVSVVIPCTDRTEGLEECLLSAINQELIGEIEVIVVENNSIDRKVVSDVVKELGSSKVKHHYLAHCINANIARNYGTQVASGEYVAYLDSDDFWDTDHLSSKLRVLSDSNGQAIYGGANINKGNRITCKTGFPLKSILNSASPALEYLFGKEVGFAQTSSYLLKRTVALEVKWDDALSRNQDYDFFIRVANFIGWDYDPNVTYTIMWAAGVGRKHHFKSYKLFFLRYKTLMTPFQASNYLFDRMLEASLKDKESYQWFRCEFDKVEGFERFSIKGMLSINRLSMCVAWFAREYVVFGRK